MKAEKNALTGPVVDPSPADVVVHGAFDNSKPFKVELLTEDPNAGPILTVFLDMGTDTTCGGALDEDGNVAAVFDFDHSVTAKNGDKDIFGSATFGLDSRSVKEGDEGKLNWLFRSGLTIPSDESRKGVKAYLRHVMKQLMFKEHRPGRIRRAWNAVTFQTPPLRFVFSIPQTEENADHRELMIEAAASLGATEIWFVPQPVAAAMGAGFDIMGDKCVLVIDIGGGTTQVWIVYKGKVIPGGQTLLNLGGHHIDDEIILEAKKKNIIIEPRMAELVKKLLCGDKTVQGPRIEGGKVHFEGIRTVKERTGFGDCEMEEALLRKVITDTVGRQLNGIYGTVETLLRKNRAGFLRDVTLDGMYVTTGATTSIPELQSGVQNIIGVPGRKLDYPGCAVPSGLKMIAANGRLLKGTGNDDAAGDGPHYPKRRR